MFTVGELKEKLDDYGDHLIVEIVIETDENSVAHQEFEVDDYTSHGREPVVTLILDLTS